MDYPTLTLLVARKRDARLHTLATWSSTHNLVSPSSAESEYCSMVRCASDAIGSANTARELEHEAREAHVRIWTDAAAARGPDLRRERRHQTDGDKVLLAAAEREEPGTQDREDPWHSRSADLMTKHLDGKRLMMLCDLLNIKHIGRSRRVQLRKLTIATEYISRGCHLVTTKR